MPYITVLAVIGVLLLQWTGSIPEASVGGSLTIALAFVAAVIAVAVHEAWTNKRGVIGWIVNILAAFAGAFVGAQLGGLAMVTLLGMVANVDGSLANTGGPVLSAALAGAMVATILAAWAVLQLVNRWR